MTTSDDPIIQDIYDHTGIGWYGLACGKGWYPIVKDVHTKIIAKYSNYEIYQIKEKFGGLRYYCNVEGDDDVQTWIAEAEEQAWKTCEDCGTTVNVTTGGNPSWIRTLCETCRGPK